MSQVRDPVTGQMMTYSQLSKLMQARRQQAQAQMPYVSENYSIVAKQPRNTGAPVMGNARDGWVKKNTGGGIPDLDDPTNRDSVPAMLTPGEYVLNKEATQMYGPVIEQMNNHGLQQRHMENQMNIGGKVKKLYNEGYTAPGQAYAIAKSMGYNTGGLVDFLKEHEGWRDKAYQDSAGVWTIGYGRTRNADGSPIRPDQTTNKADEDAWIEDRAAQELSAIQAFDQEHGYGWNPQEQEALASFRYNLGPGGFNQLTEGGARDTSVIREKLPLYTKAGGKHIEGLANRRNYELDHAGWGSLEQPMMGYSPVPQLRPGSEIPQSSNPMDLTPMVEAPDQIHIPQRSTLGEETSTYLESFFRNDGGPIPHYNEGGWFSGLRDWFGGGEPAVDPMAGYADYSQQDFLNEAENFNNPGAQLSGYEVPGMSAPSQFGTDKVPPAYYGGLDVRPNTGVATAHHAGNRFNMAFPEGQEQVPTLQTDAPPGSDQALLDMSSENVDKMRKAYREMDATEQGLEYDPRGANQVPTTDWQMTPEGMSVAQPVNPENIDKTPSVAQAWGLPIPNTRGAVPGTPDTPLRPDVPSLDVGAPIPSPTDPRGQGDGWGGNTGVPQPEGWAALTPEEFLQEAQPKDVQQADGHNVPEEADPRAADPGASGFNPISKDNAPQTKTVVEQTVQELGEPLTTDEAATAEEAGANASSSQVDKAKSLIQENFGDLFDKKELARAAVLFAGAMITGMSPQRALAYAGTNYINRIDAKEAQLIKNQQDQAEAEAKNQPYRTGQTKTVFTPDGQKINAMQVKRGKDTFYIDAKTGQEVPANVHEDASIVRGTPEYRERVQDESKQYSQTFKELQDRFGMFKGKDGSTQYATDLTPGKVGSTAAKWAIQNGVSPDGMGQLLDNAYTAARDDAQNGVRPKSIEAYLNSQYIQSKTGSAELFEGAEPQQVNAILNPLMQATGKDSTTTIQFTRNKWNQLTQEQRDSFERRAGKGKTGFMVFLQSALNGEI